MPESARDAIKARVPDEYVRRGEVVGRPELLGPSDRMWSVASFVARAETPHTTSAVEAQIRRRILGRLIADQPIDRSVPTLELGCGDGLVTRHLLELGFTDLISTDISQASVEALATSLSDGDRRRVTLVVDDLLRLPFEEDSFGNLIAWAVLSVTDDFERALELSWKWVAPGGFMLVAEPVLESVLLYALVRGDLDEFARTLAEGTRAVSWEERDRRYRVNPHGFYVERLESLPAVECVESGGVSIFPSLILGGLAREAELGDDRIAEMSELLRDPSFDSLSAWRQAYWLVRKG